MRPQSQVRAGRFPRARLTCYTEVTGHDKIYGRARFSRGVCHMSKRPLGGLVLTVSVHLLLFTSAPVVFGFA